MRLLLDESVPARLRRHLPNHSVRTVVESGWRGIKNGQLLVLAAAEFDAFVTVDKNLEFQQNLARLPIAIVVLDASSNELAVLLPLIPRLEEALQTLQAKALVRIRA